MDPFALRRAPSARLEGCVPAPFDPVVIEPGCRAIRSTQATKEEVTCAWLPMLKCRPIWSASTYATGRALIAVADH